MTAGRWDPLRQVLEVFQDAAVFSAAVLDMSEQQLITKSRAPRAPRAATSIPHCRSCERCF